MDKKIYRKSVALIVSVAMTFSTISILGACTDNEEESPSSYTFVYDLNYDGGKDRSIQIAAGKMATQYNVTRLGYVFDGWFADAACKTPYNFATPINQNTTIYALWTDESTIVYHTVTFDCGEDGVKEVQCREGKSIPAYSVVKPQKLGWQIEGWYLDEDFEEEFVIGVDPVTDSITLYPQYTEMEGVEYDENGDFVFENVEITISFKDSHHISEKAWVSSLIEAFNAEYKDRIMVTQVESYETATLSFSETSALNRYYYDYIPMVDALELAGKSYATEEYYENWTKNCYVDGTLYSMPLVSFVPVAVYNTKLMNKYNPNGTLPKNHDEFMELLKKVDDGEKEGEWYGAISMSIDTDMKQVVSNSLYVQNDIPLYSANEGGIFENRWVTDEVLGGKVLETTNLFRDMFVKDGSIGRLAGKVWQPGKAGVYWTWVGVQKSFMGVIGIPNLVDHFRWRTGKSECSGLFPDTLDAMPISYLFATGTEDEVARRIFVQNYSLAIPRAIEGEIAQVAAAAIFADYMSQNCEASCESAFYPVRKSVHEKMFANPQLHWSIDAFLRKCGNPNDFYTYPGTPFEYSVANGIQSSYLMQSICWLDDDASDEEVQREIALISQKINKEIGV